MVSVSVELRTVEGTQAAMGWADGRAVVVDRTKGQAGGQGLGFNGAQLLALAIGGCFYNDLRYVAEDMGIGLGNIAVTVTIELKGDPLQAAAARMSVLCDTLDGSDPQRIIDAAKKICMIINSLRKDIPVTVEPTVAKQERPKTGHRRKPGPHSSHSP